MLASMSLIQIEIDACVQAILATLGTPTGAARSYVFEFESDAVMNNTHEWCAAGIEAQREQLQGVPADMFSWWIAEIRAGRAIMLRTLDDLPPAAAAERELLAAQDIVQLLAVPLLVGARLRGFVGIDIVGEPRGIDATTRATVEHAARAIGSLLSTAELARARIGEVETRVRRLADLDASAALSAGLVHDLANLLVVVSLHTELALERVAHDDPEREPLDDMLSLVQRASALLRRLLALLGGQRAALVAVELDTSANELARMLARAFEPKVHLRIDLHAPDAQIIGPPSLLDQALLNLLVNARDASPQGGIVELRTRIDPLAHQAIVTVSDMGPGVAPELREQIFAPFFTTKGAAGTGLGLFNVRHAVEQLGGSIRVDVAALGGACFEIRLPLAARTPRLAELVSDVLARGELGLLLVEHERALRVVLRRSLDQLGFAVDCADQLDAARSELDADRHAIVLLDLHLAEGTLELVREARARGRTVIGMTSEPTSAVALTAEGLGAQLLVKPFRRGVLEELLGRSRQ
jgi:signal transduction histidine kinase/CheY-like chemotaxis protein